MHSSGFTQLLSLLLLLAPVQTFGAESNVIPLKKVVKRTTEGGVANVELLKNDFSKAINKINHGFRAFELNTGITHPSDNNGHRILLEKRETAAIPLVNNNDMLWEVTISVGTPPSSFNVLFDTGSSELVLPGINCVNCEGRQLYNASSSGTAHDLKRPFEVQYGNYSEAVSGEVFTDTVAVGGLTVTNQVVGVASNYFSDIPPEDVSGGIIGMAFKQLSVFGSIPFFQTAMQQGKPTLGEFGVKLAENGAELFLGGVNSKLFSGAFTIVPVTVPGYWQVQVDGINVNGRVTVQHIDGIIDTGTSVIIGDSNSVRRFYAAIPGAQSAANTIGEGFYTFPCRQVPNVSLTFSGQRFTVSAETFNLGRVSAGSSQCVGGILAIEGINLWIVGDVFLQNVYTVFNVQNRTVGFASLA